MQANEITHARLRQLAGVRPAHGKVLSLYLNLDPTQFATPPARSSEIRSVLSRAERLVREDERLSHDERESLKDDLERVRDYLGGDLDTQGAHAVAIFCSGAANLFEVIKLPRPVPDEAIVTDTPYVEPLVGIGAREYWCVLLANRHVARILCGSREQLREIESIEADLTTVGDVGGPYPANESRTTDRDVEQHFKNVSRVMLDRFGRRPPDALLVGAPRELVNQLEARLHPDMRRKLCGRIEVDVEHSSVDDVRAAAEPVIAAVARRRDDETLERLRERLGIGERAVAGVEAVLGAITEQRVETLLVDDGLTVPGRRCPTCDLLTLAATARCPADGAEMAEVEDVVEAAVERALGQSADVLVLRNRPDLAENGSIAALLRF
jgi:peptide chain release factor subunit 1